MTNIQTDSPGIENLAQVIAGHLPPYPEPSAGPASAVRKMTAPGAGNITGTLAEARQQMIRNTLSLLNGLSGLNVRDLFLLRPGQLHTLENLGTDPEAVAFVKSVNYLSQTGPDYAYNSLLKTIATIPPAGLDGGPPDWKNWWLIWAREHPGPRRHHKPEAQSPAESVLNRVIAAMAKAAAQHWPAAPDLIAFAGGAKQSGSLANACTLAGHVAATAQAMGLSPESIPYRHIGPEALAGQLDQSGTAYRKDIGRVSDLPAMKELLGKEGLKEIYTCRKTGIWYGRDTSDGYIIAQNAPAGDCLRTRLVAPGPDRSNGGPRNYEEALAEMLAPPAGDRRNATLDEITTHLTTAHVARVNLMSPQAITEFFAGDAAAPGAEIHPVCPMHEECRSVCGAAQRAGLFPFPLTWDGRFESCRYWRFRAENAGKDPVNRELSARLAYEKLAGKNRTTTRPETAEDRFSTAQATQSPAGKAKKSRQAASQPRTEKASQQSMF